MSDRLDGSFSGLWTCELCGRTGVECTCEHFSRGGGAWGPDKEFSDAELAAEAYRQLVRACAGTGLASFEDGNDVKAFPLDVAVVMEAGGELTEENLTVESWRVQIVNRFATLGHASRMDYFEGFLKPGGASRAE